MEIDLKKAKPGSDYAVENGCKCPVLDNCRGNGYLGIEDQFVISPQCPLHGYMPESTYDHVCQECSVEFSNIIKDCSLCCVCEVRKDRDQCDE